jgi:hypothetical protein
MQTVSYHYKNPTQHDGLVQSGPLVQKTIFKHLFNFPHLDPLPMGINFTSYSN